MGSWEDQPGRDLKDQTKVNTKGAVTLGVVVCAGSKLWAVLAMVAPSVLSPPLPLLASPVDVCTLLSHAVLLY